MKKYLPGIVATLLAVTAVAFTNVPKNQMMVDGKEGSMAGDPCLNVNKRWFLINLECLEQNFLADITTPDNYVAVTASQAGEACMGTECVCAIYACQGTNLKPIITQGTTIYNALFNYYYEGTGSIYIMHKDQYYSRKASK